MKSADIALYLLNNPQFFEDNADMLAEVTIPHPYSGRTISLNERQLLTLREQNKSLEKKLQEMVTLAKDNDALQQKVHQFTLALFGAQDLMSLQNIITQNLREIFSVPHAVLHIWKGLPPSAEVLAFADQQLLPVCIQHALHDTLPWFGESAAHLHSFAYLPLRADEKSIGLLILASEDSQRFYPGMGTMFLQRIAEIVSSALRPSL
ncbi:DUF484 family protein [Candidatus Nitrotoga sp. M5]|uniref:DUF484 family protein n=1 Tax=Candidatus Nitrotoga sp. M5 TaxID=2890409 RepID=UPI001EF1D06D|nr:DUF484 family protein [Candidatus Nitrotoga sp. M5]CAH1385835.1 conserved hypothetical protein [Candidatus Nitrotoga sp. M5]